MRIQSKFLITSVISAICVLVLAGVTQWTSSIKLDQAHLIGAISAITQRHMEADMMHDAIRGDVLSAIIASEGAAETIDAIDADFAEHYKNLRQNLEDNSNEPLPHEIKALFANALVALNNYGGSASELIPFMKTKAPYKDKLEDFDTKFKELEKDNELISDKIALWSEQVTAEASSMADWAETIAYILTIIAVCSTLFIPYYAYKIIFSPQRILTEVMNRLADNDLSVEIEGADRKDEIGEIANALVIFRKNAREKIKLQEDQKAAELRNVEEQATALKNQENSVISEMSGILNACANGDFTHRLDIRGRTGLILHLSEGMNKICEVCLHGLSEVKETLRHLSNGDLTKNMAGNHHGIFEDIQDSINGTITNLSGMVTKIRDVSISVSSASSEIASGSVDLSSRTEQQASTLEETSASMEQLTTAVRQNTQSAREANSLSEQSFKCAEVGGMIAKTAVDSIIKIQESSQKITDIISTIDDIAFQTNLLALNASVEAARAGEAGKGFAVVASEVRSLASRSAAASKEIKELISSSMSQVNHGVELVNQSGKSLEDIISSIKSVTEYVARIVKSSEDQASGIEEINSAVSQIDEATQQNAALVEQNSAASQAMADLGTQLYNLITFFKVDDSSNADEIRRITV